ncbi:hypothetical protein BAUCODRAFT_21747 [Baudoinia panamericana UAMH 10762]|uniref:Chromo domain-containing protein n=1 Tax=Baudoinia panamericana (strain UAMH 10762) TaxID=717646 RepID=M2MT83_BAUPA|nr:uncharacterized protein BAUCODRAFT_21747 [Baudoinia panamericana UAMH 10762]EMD00087.1 hypothetical protein BAUCODRAFT_21747 [Baudoinia panamericana UAMH 10762]
MAGTRRELQNLHIDAKPSLTSGQIARSNAQTYNYKGSRYECEAKETNNGAAQPLSTTKPSNSRRALEAIIGEKVVNGKSMYLAKWADHPAADATWGPVEVFGAQKMADWQAEKSLLEDTELGVDIDEALELVDLVEAGLLDDSILEAGNTMAS